MAKDKTVPASRNAGMCEWNAFIDLAAAVSSSRKPGADNRSEEGSEEFTGTPDFAAAIKLARDGWQDGTKAVSAALDSVHADQSDALPGWTMQAAGHFPCVPAYLSGEPECMWQQTDDQRPERRITLLVPIGYPCVIEAERATNYAAAVAACARALDATGVSVAVYGIWTGFDTSQSRCYGYGVKIRAHGEPMDLSKIAYASHPSFARRVNFAYREQHELLTPVACSGYGYSAETWSRDYVCAVAGDAGVQLLCPGIFDLYQSRQLGTTDKAVAALHAGIQADMAQQAKTA